MRWVSNEARNEKWLPKKLALLIHSPKIKEKVFFLRMNHLSSYVLRMMKDLHSKLSFSKQATIKNLMI